MSEADDVLRLVRALVEDRRPEPRGSGVGDVPLTKCRGCGERTWWADWCPTCEEAD